MKKTSTHNVEIRIGHSVADVHPAHEDLLGPILSYEDLSFDANEEGGVNHCRGLVRCYTLESGDRLRISAGCVPRICDALRSAGYDVSIRDFRRMDTVRHQVDGGYAHIVELSFLGLASCIASRTEGVVEIARGTKRMQAIGTICRLLPRARCFIASAKIDTARTLAARLAGYVNGDVNAVHGGNWSSPCRVVCGTYTSYDTSDASDWDVLIFDDAVEALGRKTHENRGNYSDHRVYAFAAPERERNSKQQLQFEVLFGPTIYRLASGRQEFSSPKEVWFARYSAALERFPTDTLPRRRAVWSSHTRNQAIADVARGLTRPDYEMLWNHGLFLSSAPSCFPSWPRACSVVIIVESAEHGKILKRLLPEWKLIHKQNKKSVDLRKSWGMIPHQSIVTTVVAADHCSCCDVAVLACGGSSPQIPARLARTNSVRVIIDFADEINDELADNTRQRIRAYREHGWTVADWQDLKRALSRNLKPKSKERRPSNTSRRPKRRLYRH